MIIFKNTFQNLTDNPSLFRNRREVTRALPSLRKRCPTCLGARIFKWNTCEEVRIRVDDRILENSNSEVLRELEMSFGLTSHKVWFCYLFYHFGRFYFPLFFYIGSAGL